jgi:GntR family transcriptional regulator, transcriptional repressor for pyruvate dehydrogenase complex
MPVLACIFGPGPSEALTDSAADVSHDGTNPPNGSDVVARPSLIDNSNKVRARVLALMERGGIGPDGRLETERELCDRLGVGRRTVRRVLEALEAEGLIWRRQGKGTFAGQAPDPTGALAAEITGETVPAEVMEARLWIEPALAALCARRARPEDVARMRHLARRVSEAREHDSAELWDSALHRLIARVAGNRPLLTSFALLDEIRTTDSWLALRARHRNLQSQQVNDAQHDSIIEAIAAGDARAAETAMRAHMQTLSASLARSIAETRRETEEDDRPAAILAEAEPDHSAGECR